MWYTSSDGRINLEITLKQAQAAYHSGACDADVLELSKHPRVRRQFAKLRNASIVAELREYGAWDDVELLDFAQNVQRLLWVACADIVERHA